MAHSIGKYADFEALREQAVALRRTGHSLRQTRDELKLFNRLVKGEPPPEWTKRPQAKDDLRQRARELRLQGWTYDRIETELGTYRGLIAGAALRKRQRSLAKAGRRKPYDRRENVVFVNSDPGMIEVFLAWLDLLEVERDRLRFTVVIHETADIGAAERYWAELVNATPDSFNRTTVKKRNPKTVRKNTGDDYRGCLAIKVLKGADLYRRIEGSWYGIVEAAREADQSIRT
ncbi:hypothetical protein [Streptomyces echinatus]|uniref:hypothetical protein n=1 Tax=Streptomyces echinatus TaxID=67293 RepID=UPI0037BD84E0